MNDHLKISPHGLRLIKEFEGFPRLKARLCEGNRWELGWGCTYYPDDTPVAEGDAIELPYATTMLQHALRVTEDAVKRLVTVPISQHQFDGLCAFVYNVGEANAATSTVIRETNAGRRDDAAAAFGMWIYATNGAGHKQALRGLVRRRYAEATCYLGYDWTEACEDDAIALKREPPATLPGRDRVIYKTPFKDVLAVAQRYPLSEPADAILFEPAPTPAAVPKVAAAPVPDSAIAIPEDVLVLDTPAAPATGPAAGQPGAAHPTQPSPPAAPAPKTPAATGSGHAGPAVAPKPAPVEAPSPVSHPGNAPVPPVVFPKGEPKVVPPPPVVVAGQDGAKPKSPNTLPPAEVPYRIDPNAGLKPIDETDRGKGYVLQQVGIGVIRLGSLGVFGTTIQAGAQTVQGDPVLSNILLMGFVAGGIIVVGYVVRVYGDWKRKRGEANASQGMY